MTYTQDMLREMMSINEAFTNRAARMLFNAVISGVTSIEERITEEIKSLPMTVM